MKENSNKQKESYKCLSKLFISIGNIFKVLSNEEEITEKDVRCIDKLYNKSVRLRKKKVKAKTINGFTFFMREFRGQILKEKPSLTATEVFKELARTWKNEVDEETKKKFNNLAKLERESNFKKTDTK